MKPLEERIAERERRRAEAAELGSPEALPEAVEKAAKKAGKAGAKGKAAENDPHAGNGGGAPAQSPAWPGQ